MLRIQLTAFNLAEHLTIDFAGFETRDWSKFSARLRIPLHTDDTPYHIIELPVEIQLVLRSAAKYREITHATLRDGRYVDLHLDPQYKLTGAETDELLENLIDDIETARVFEIHTIC